MAVRRTSDEIERWIVDQLATHLRMSPDEIDPTEPPVRYGADSLTLVTIAGDLEIWLDMSLAPNLLWEYPTIAQLSAALAAAGSEGSRSDGEPSESRVGDPSTGS